jgi:hypothetical protein
MNAHDVQDLLARYRAAASGTTDENSEQQNKSADRVHACYKSLRETPEGREGIIALISDPNPQVQLWAASHSLAWSPDAARPVLERLRDSGEFPTSFTAEMTLAEFDKGALSFDY